MSEIEITIDNGGITGGEHLRVQSTGQLADALRSCVVRIGQRYAGDPAMQRLAAAVEHLDLREEA
jgi:hypothetical protein